MKGIAFAAILAVLPSCAVAQTQDQADRVDQLASYTLQSAYCTKFLGFVVAGGGAEFDRAMVADSRLAGLDAKAANQLYVQALERRSRSFKIDLEASQAELGTDFAKLQPWFLDHARRCQQIAADPTFSKLLRQPVGFEAEAAATRAADALLEAGGLASWQTPTIQARGDLLMTAGACRRHIGAARSDALFRQFGSTADARERAYYARVFQEGLNDNMGLDATQCERAISGFREKAAP